MKILVVEDNPRLVVHIKKQLQKQYTIDVAISGHEALHSATTKTYDLILLDLGLPDTHGLEVCQQIRKSSADLPILIITGEDSIASRVSLLENGADDYISKPFNIEELRARINALARRRKRSVSESLITVGDLVINPASREVSRNGTPIVLRRKEFDILEYLATNAGRIMSREMIVHYAWPSTTTSWPGSVDVHIKQLRDKVDRPFPVPLIKTSYGVGYTIELPNKTHVTSAGIAWSSKN